MCDSSSATGFFTCTNNLWVSMTCSTGNECRTVNDEAVCMNPADPTPSDSSDVSAPKIPCDSLNSTMCDSSSKSSFYMCLDYNWTKMQCDGANVCMERNGSTACVDQATADAPQLPCTTANATQCVDGDMTLFQICIDNYWTNSSCSDNNYCLYRGGQALCVDKATAEAPVQPCTTANATRCVDNDDTVFQICYDNFWTNSTCSAGTICGTKQGNAVCHDPTIPIIDVPDQPCDVEKATRCFSGNHTIYQLCYNGLWSNQTCDGGNVCFAKDSDATCMDPTLASIEGATFILSSPEQFRALSSAVSLSNVYSWGTAVLLCAIVTAFGAGI
ncbi:hypothetical protein IW150_004421 [Coemansia sp. RSA 2607]|nr:hypothetical protein IW150_004421 [Coemansia sp. RSA 2607]